MERDIKVGLVLGIILVALIAVLFFRRSPQPDHQLALLEQADPGPEELPVVRTRAEPYQVPPEYLRSILGSRLSGGTGDTTTPSGDTSAIVTNEAATDAASPSDAAITEREPLATTTSTQAPPDPLYQPPPPASDVPSEPLPGRRYVVRRGDTLANLARRAYGRESLYTLIYEANKDRLASPNELPLGLEIYIPPAPSMQSTVAASNEQLGVPVARVDRPATTAPPATDEPRRYVVQPGDTLQSIAVKVYGRESMYRAILRANRHVLASPADLRPGLTLVLP